MSLHGIIEDAEMEYSEVFGSNVVGSGSVHFSFREVVFRVIIIKRSWL